MKERRKKKFRVIHGSDAQTFEDALNKAMDELKEVTVTFDTNLPFLAYIQHIEYEYIPQCLKDVYELRGERHVCSECQYFEKPTDKRVKNVYCAIGEYTRATSEACEIFYKELNKGGE